MSYHVEYKDEVPSVIKDFMSDAVCFVATSVVFFVGVELILRFLPRLA